jgi:hypothetical protein
MSKEDYKNDYGINLCMSNVFAETYIPEISSAICFTHETSPSKKVKSKAITVTGRGGL